LIDQDPILNYLTTIFDGLKTEMDKIGSAFHLSKKSSLIRKGESTRKLATYDKMGSYIESTAKRNNEMDTIEEAITKIEHAQSIKKAH
jgi:hypothetical protein